VGDILNKSLRLFLARSAPLIGLSIIAYTPCFIFGWGERASSPWAALTANPALIVIEFACSSLAHPLVTYGVIQQLRGRRFTFAAALQIGFRRLAAVIGVNLLVGILAAAAAIFLIVPGVIACCEYAVAVPVCVVERLSPTASMGRSRFLVKGKRWRIFGILTLAYVPTLGLRVTLFYVVTYIVAVTGGLQLSLMTFFLLDSICDAFNALVLGVLYYRLRTAKEGIDIEHIAEVFD
jgi:hypothetical protein